MGTKVQRTCLECNKEFLIFKAWLRDGNGGKYCSRSCASKNLPMQKNNSVQKFCIECGASFVVKGYRETTAFFCSRTCLAIARGRKMRGENHPFWTGGHQERPWEARKWAKKVKDRDKNMCVECLSAVQVQAHHIKDWVRNSELRYDINNGTTLCPKCHATKHEDLQAFILSKYNVNLIRETVK